MKKTLCCILVLVLVFASGTTVFAAEINMIEDSISLGNSYAMLTSEDGDVYYIKIDNVETAIQTTTQANGEIAVTKSVLINGENLISSTATQNNEREDWDSTASIKAYTTIYFKESGSPKTYLITKVTGGFTYYDLDVDVKAQKVIIGCKGPFPSYTDQKITKYPTGTSFSEDTGFTKYVLPTRAEIGASYTLTIGRNGKTWELKLLNSLTSEDSWSLS